MTKRSKNRVALGGNVETSSTRGILIRDHGHSLQNVAYREKY